MAVNTVRFDVTFVVFYLMKCSTRLSNLRKGILRHCYY